MTASYKAFWFLALIDIVAHRPCGNDSDRFVSFDEMRDGMLAAAFWPAVRYRLSFGKSDRIHERLEELRSDEGNEVLPTLRDERSRGILRHVPQRFLVPWLPNELSGIPSSRIDSAIVGLSASAFETPGRILYRLSADGIEIDRSWYGHLSENIGIMRAFGERELIRFLQSRNPTVPGIADKISDARRRSLAEQTTFWRDATTSLRLPCFYSGRPLEGEFSLDHFVPWSFVVHDRIWNLVPALRSVNSSKGLRVPDESLVLRLCSVHLTALRDALARDPAFISSRLAAAYETDLRIDLKLALDEEVLAAHRDAVLPLVALARQSGFPGGWIGKTASAAG